MYKRQVLVESAAGEENHELHAQAYAEHWAIGGGRGEFSDELEFDLLASGMDGHGGGVCWHTEGLCDGIIAAGEDERVVEVDVDGPWESGREDGEAAGGVDGVGVVAWGRESLVAVVLDRCV